MKLTNKQKEMILKISDIICIFLIIGAFYFMFFFKTKYCFEYKDKSSVKKTKYCYENKSEYEIEYKKKLIDVTYKIDSESSVNLSDLVIFSDSEIS